MCVDCAVSCVQQSSLTDDNDEQHAHSHQDTTDHGVSVNHDGVNTGHNGQFDDYPHTRVNIRTDAHTHTHTHTKTHSHRGIDSGGENRNTNTGVVGSEIDTLIEEGEDDMPCMSQLSQISVPPTPKRRKYRLPDEVEEEDHTVSSTPSRTVCIDGNVTPRRSPRNSSSIATTPLSTRRKRIKCISTEKVI